MQQHEAGDPQGRWFRVLPNGQPIALPGNIVCPSSEAPSAGQQLQPQQQANHFLMPNADSPTTSSPGSRGPRRRRRAPHRSGAHGAGSGSGGEESSRYDSPRQRVNDPAAGPVSAARRAPPTLVPTGISAVPPSVPAARPPPLHGQPNPLAMQPPQPLPTPVGLAHQAPQQLSSWSHPAPAFYAPVAPAASSPFAAVAAAAPGQQPFATITASPFLFPQSAPVVCTPFATAPAFAAPTTFAAPATFAAANVAPNPSAVSSPCFAANLSAPCVSSTPAFAFAPPMEEESSYSNPT